MDLEYLTKGYQTTDEGRRLVLANNPIFVVGPSGAGTSTLTGELEKTGEYIRAVSTTTRALRINNGKVEEEGVNYHFVGRGYGESMLFAHRFIEAHPVHGELYGSTIAELKRIHDLGKRAVLDIDPQGADDYMKLSPNLHPIFILPPDVSTLHERLLQRAGDPKIFEETWQRRSKNTLEQVDWALANEKVRLLVNRDLGQASLELQSLAASQDGDAGYDDSGARAAAGRLRQELFTLLQA